MDQYTSLILGNDAAISGEIICRHHRHRKTFSSLDGGGDIPQSPTPFFTNPITPQAFRAANSRQLYLRKERTYLIIVEITLVKPPPKGVRGNYTRV
jgi:hypothetical protein